MDYEKKGGGQLIVRFLGMELPIIRSYVYKYLILLVMWDYLNIYVNSYVVLRTFIL